MKETPVPTASSLKRCLHGARELAITIISKEASEHFDKQTIEDIKARVLYWFTLPVGNQQGTDGPSLDKDAEQYARRVFVLAADVYRLRIHVRSLFEWYQTIHSSRVNRSKLDRYRKDRVESGLPHATDLAFEILEELYSSSQGKNALLYFYFEPNKDNRRDVDKYPLPDSEIIQVRHAFWLATMAYGTESLFKHYDWYGRLSKNTKLAAKAKEYRNSIEKEERY